MFTVPWADPLLRCNPTPSVRSGLFSLYCHWSAVQRASSEYHIAVTMSNVAFCPDSSQADEYPSTAFSTNSFMQKISAPAGTLIFWRRVRDSNPRWVAPHSISSRLAVLTFCEVITGSFVRAEKLAVAGLFESQGVQGNSNQSGFSRYGQIKMAFGQTF